MMNDKEQLYYLIKEFRKGSYNTEDFCDEFTKVYDLETNYRNLTLEENKYFNELSNMTARFSQDEEDLKVPNLYYNEGEIIKKVIEVINTLSIDINSNLCNN